MGCTLTTLKKLSTNFGYYFFLIGDYSNNAPINNFFREEFSAIASRLNENAVIIAQTRKSKIEDELNEEIRKLQSTSTTISKFFNDVSSQYPGLLILRKHPYDLTDKDAIIYIPFITINSVYNNTEELLIDLAEFTKGNNQLLTKINEQIKKDKKLRVTGFSVGANIGFFSINVDFKL